MSRDIVSEGDTGRLVGMTVPSFPRLLQQGINAIENARCAAASLFPG